MLKNEKIAKYVVAKDSRKSLEFQSYLKCFTDNFYKFKDFLEDNDNGDGITKYKELSAHIANEHGIYGKNGGICSSKFVFNLYKLARREIEANRPRRRLPPEKDTVFRIFHPDDL